MTTPINPDIPEAPEWRHKNYKDIVRNQREFRERLPLPYVTYPDVYGTWLSFRESPDSEPWFCECQRRSMVNFLRINEETKRYRLRKEDSLLSLFLSGSAAASLPKVHSVDELRESDRFRDSLCHRCNGRVPSVRWSNLGSHSVFMQHFGWFVSQELYANGIDWFSPFLRDQCPEDLLALLEPNPWDLQIKLAECAKKHGYRIFPIARLPPEFRKDPDEERHIIETVKALKRVQRSVDLEIENRLRKSLGFPKKGKTGNHETILYLIAKGVFPETEVMRNSRPEFLDGLTLDIYIPDRKIALEYQGLQHYKPMRHLGGVKKFEELCERDQRKRKLCSRAGVVLIYFDRSDKLTEDYVGNKINVATKGSG